MSESGAFALAVVRPGGQDRARAGKARRTASAWQGCLFVPWRALCGSCIVRTSTSAGSASLLGGGVWSIEHAILAALAPS